MRTPEDLYQHLGPNGDIFIRSRKYWLEIKKKHENSCCCPDPDCGKCLLVNCKDEYCSTHPMDKKKRFKDYIKNRNLISNDVKKETKEKLKKIAKTIAEYILYGIIWLVLVLLVGFWLNLLYQVFVK